MGGGVGGGDLGSMFFLLPSNDNALSLENAVSVTFGSTNES